MVNADLMDAIDRSLRQARGRRAEPFGGVQVVMFGDPYQLAPVPPRGDEARYIRRPLPLVLVLRRQGLGRRGRPRRPHRRRLVRRRAAHPRAGRHPPAGGSGVQGDAERRAARSRDGRHRPDPQRHGRSHPPGPGGWRASDHHARDAQRHRQQHQPAAPPGAGRSRADRHCRSQRRLRQGRCLLPGRRRAASSRSGRR